MVKPFNCYNTFRVKTHDISTYIILSGSDMDKIGNVSS